MATTTWVIDPAHSEVQFKVKHMMITTVTGQLTSFESTVEADSDDFTNAKVHFSADMNSITTNNEQRDGHLKSADFFDLENNPKLTFESTGFEKAGGDKFKLTGDLTIRGISKPVTLDVEFGGINKDPWGNLKAGFTVTGKINRKDWGLNWNAALESGGVLVSDEVRINCDVQFSKQA
jgi:polyisoprenoid-binding protein YceI